MENAQKEVEMNSLRETVYGLNGKKLEMNLIIPQMAGSEIQWMINHTVLPRGFRKKGQDLGSRHSGGNSYIILGDIKKPCNRRENRR